MYAIILEFRNGILIFGSGLNQGLENHRCLTENGDKRYCKENKSHPKVKFCRFISFSLLLCS